MLSEITCNPEAPNSTTSPLISRSVDLMSKQDAVESEKECPSPARDEVLEAKACPDFSQESIAAVLSIDAKPEASVEHCSIIA